MFIFILCVLVALVPDFSKACGPDPSKWTPQEREMYECLKSQGWSNEQMLNYYNRVFKPETRSGRASRHDQYIVRGCLTTEDFLKYGVIPDGYTTTTTTPGPDTFSDVAYQERMTLLCLRANGMSDQQLRAWYNRLPNSATRSGRVLRRNQDLALNCIPPVNYLYHGAAPYGGYRTAFTTRAPANRISYATTQPEHLTPATPRDEKIFDCLRKKSWSDKQIQTWYNRVLNSETRSRRATLYDQDMVRGCVNDDDYRYYGVIADSTLYRYSYSSTTSSPGGGKFWGS